MPNPFPVDPAVMARIRAIEHRDCAHIAQMHRNAMGNSLWSQLGSRFLRELYRGLVDSPYFLGFVYEERDDEGQQKIMGFIAGSTDTNSMYSGVFQRRWALLGATALPGLLRRPWVLARLLQTPKYSKLSSPSEAKIPGESLFCSFAPELRGKRISGHINKVLFDELLARGHSEVKVSTEQENEGANRQLTSWGFEPIHHFQFYGKAMVTYVLNLEESERVEPRSVHRAV